jgi:DNA-binding MarR family transcriptional regulator
VYLTAEGERKLAEVDVLIHDIEETIARRMGKGKRDEFLKLTKLFQQALVDELAEQ